MRSALLVPLLLLILGSAFLIYSLIPREDLIEELVLENGTYEMVRCRGAITVQANGSLCVDLREVRLREVAQGSSVNEAVEFPLLEVRGSRIELTVSNYGVVWSRSYDFLDGGYLIPMERGKWNLSASSDGEITLYEVEEYDPVKGDLVKSGNSIRVNCGSTGGAYLILYNPSREPLRARVVADHYIDPHFLSISIGLILMALLARRYFHAVENRGGAIAGAGRYAHG